MIDLISFKVAGQRAAIRTDEVVEVVRAVLPTPLSGGPAILEGIINLRGRLLPVFALAERLGMSGHALDPQDHFIVARAGSRTVALRAEGRAELIRIADQDIAAAGSVTATTAPVAGLARLPDGILLICDLRAFLSDAEALAVDRAVNDAAERGLAS